MEMLSSYVCRSISIAGARLFGYGASAGISSRAIAACSHKPKMYAGADVAEMMVERGQCAPSKKYRKLTLGGITSAWQATSAAPWREAHAKSHVSSVCWRVKIRMKADLNLGGGMGAKRRRMSCNV